MRRTGAARSRGSRTKGFGLVPLVCPGEKEKMNNNELHKAFWEGFRAGVMYGAGFAGAVGLAFGALLMMMYNG